MYSSKVRLQYIKISAWLHMIEAQERHEKSPKKMTSTHARCGSSGGLLICIFAWKTNLDITVSITLHSNYFLFTFILLYTIEQQLPSSPQPQFPSTVIKTLPTDIWADWVQFMSACMDGSIHWVQGLGYLQQIYSTRHDILLRLVQPGSEQGRKRRSGQTSH